MRHIESFRQMLMERQKKVNSLVCVGLDPLMDKRPVCTKDLEDWMMRMVDAVEAYTSMFKPQHAHWEKIHGGVDVLRRVIRYINFKYPDIPVFMDCKRGDIDRTQEQYRITHLDNEGADGMNYNGYMGIETLSSLIDPENMGRGLVGLGRTSNEKAWEMQDTPLANGRKLWEDWAFKQMAWSVELGVIKDAGIVMGAAYRDSFSRVHAEHLTRARDITLNSLWLLIPGVGTQGGLVEETVRASFNGPGSMAINSSSGIIFASSGNNFEEAAAYKAEELMNQIRSAGGNCS